LSETVPKIQTVILSEAKNLIVFLFKSKNKKRDPSALRPQDDKERQIYKNFGTASAFELL
jgi:hypothetical protein